MNANGIVAATVGTVAWLALGSGAAGAAASVQGTGGPLYSQPPMGANGLSFRADISFPVGDDFISPGDDAVARLRWWGSVADESVPHDTSATTPFRIRFYTSAGGLPYTLLATYEVDASEAWTGGYCRGIEGLGGNFPCVGPEPLYVYEATIDPPFVPTAGTEYWLVMKHQVNQEPIFWAWHEADLAHPTGNEAVTGVFGAFIPGLINSCPADFSFLVGPYDLAFELESGTVVGTGFCDCSAGNSPCGNGGAAGNGCANSAFAQGAHLAATGSVSVGAGDLVLHGSNLVPSQPGLYFQGDNAINGGQGVPFGDGLRCAGGNVVRLEVVGADATGNSATGVDIAAKGGASAGDLKRYQLWYRDPQASPCGTGFNLTNGLEILWEP